LQTSSYAFHGFRRSPKAGLAVDYLVTYLMRQATENNQGRYETLVLFQPCSMS
jgi:hypothetical protein